MTSGSLRRLSQPTIILGAISLSLLVSLLIVLTRPTFPLSAALMFLPFFLMLAFAFIHGWWSMSRGIVVLFLVSVVITFFVEWLSINFGVPFGHYHYTDKLGVLILGVPWVIPLQWFNVLYPSYFMACILFPTGAMKGSKMSPIPDLRLAILRGLSAAAMMVGWDLINDSLMANVVEMWIWESPSEFFGLTFDGIPLSNYIGWAITVFVVVSLYESVRYRQGFSVSWIENSPREYSNVFVVVPYAFNYLIQFIQALGLGTLASTIVVPIPVILISSAVLFNIVVVIVYAYIKHRRIT